MLLFQKKEKSKYRIRGGFSQTDGISQFSPHFGRNCPQHQPAFDPNRHNPNFGCFHNPVLGNTVEPMTPEDPRLGGGGDPGEGRFPAISRRDNSAKLLSFQTQKNFFQVLGRGIGRVY